MGTISNTSACCSTSLSSFLSLSYCWPSCRVSVVEANMNDCILESPLSTGLIIDAFGELRDQLEGVKENLEVC